jgi:hypothetical protein
MYRLKILIFSSGLRFTASHAWIAPSLEYGASRLPSRENAACDLGVAVTLRLLMYPQPDGPIHGFYSQTVAALPESQSPPLCCWTLSN